jgi:hypothetical protein
VIIIKHDPDEYGFDRGAELTFVEAYYTLEYGNFTEGTILVLDVENKKFFSNVCAGAEYRVDRAFGNVYILVEATLPVTEWEGY